MLHWINIILGVLLVLFLLGYAFIVICSLVENTGRTIFSVLVGLCHALSPAAFVFAGYPCLHRKAAETGILRASFGGMALVLLYVCIMMGWSRLALGDGLPEWCIGLLTAAQVLMTGLFVHGFLYW